MSYKSVKLRYMLSFARSADLKITDEKERCRALHWQCRTAHSDFVVLIYVDNRILWVKGQSCHTNDTIPNYSPTGRLNSWTLLFGAREVIYAVGNILSQEHYFTWETRNYDSVLRTYLRKKHLVTRALFHRGEGNLSICISRVAVLKRSRSLSPNGPSYL